LPVRTEINFRVDDLSQTLPVILENTIVSLAIPLMFRNRRKSTCTKNVLDFEPASALFVKDSDPLLYYRAIVEFAKNHLSIGGLILIENQ